jgi:hypothetical protein
MSEVRAHVLVWVAPEFLQSSGLVRIFAEAGVLPPSADDLEEYIRSAESAGGFAMTGMLAEARHGAGIWISPANTPGLELMVPWNFVRSVVTAESAESKAFGLMRSFLRPNGVGNHPPGGNGDTNSTL